MADAKVSRTVAQPEAQSADAVRAEAAGWWEQRRRVAENAWELPFPPRAGQTVRVIWQRPDPAGGTPEQWLAGLIRPRTLTAYIEVHSSESAIAALESLYQHVV